MKRRKTEQGITLIALVITIIVLLILAGITISLTVGEDGIISKAQQAAQEMEIAEIKEKIKLDILEAETEAIIRGESLEQAQLNDIVAKYGELQEDGDTIITNEDKFEISLKEIWYGVLSDSGSYTDKLEQIEILENEYTNFKTTIAEAITDMGVETSPKSDVNTMVSNIKSISGHLGTVYYVTGFSQFWDVKEANILYYTKTQTNNTVSIYGLSEKSYSTSGGTLLHSDASSDTGLKSVDISQYDYIRVYMLADMKDISFE